MTHVDPGPPAAGARGDEVSRTAGSHRSQADGSQPDADVVELFEEPARWRADVIRRLHLAGDELVEAATPSPAFPQLLWFVSRAVGSAPPGPVVDVGAGLGGLAHALRASTGRDAVALEPSAASCDEARRLFPELPTARAAAAALPLAGGSVACAVLCGVVSLLDDADAVFRDVARCVRPDGRVVVLDLVPSTAQDVRAGPNRFRAVETLESELEAAGFIVEDRAVASVEAGRWGDVADQVNREIIRRYRGDAGFGAWLDDHRHVARVLASGRVLMAGVAARRR
jgi:SAM-dependent methyltransferase